MLKWTDMRGRPNSAATGKGGTPMSHPAQPRPVVLPEPANCRQLDPIGNIRLGLVPAQTHARDNSLANPHRPQTIPKCSTHGPSDLSFTFALLKPGLKRTQKDSKIDE